MPVLKEIDEWFSERSEWHRKAYEHLRAGNRTDTAFIEELTRLCVDESSRETTKAKTKRPESLGETVEQTVGAVRLLGLQNVQNINRLAPQQKLTFAPDGLTVVYGDNGAGKSGYGRILRQVCQARGPASELRGNVFLDAQPAGTAEVIHSVDGNECPLIPVTQGRAAVRGAVAGAKAFESVDTRV